MSINFYKHKKYWKFFLLINAIAIGAFTLIYTNNLSKELKEEERKKAELWAQATKQLISSNESDSSIKLTLDIIKSNTTIPVILTDQNKVVLFSRNLEVPEENKEKFLQKKIVEMEKQNPPFIVNLGKGEKQYFYYQDSVLIQKLSWFPIIQILVVGLFITIAYLAFSGSRKAEQDQVWVGMSKETAHQLGTPTTSMLGWVDVLKMNEETAPLGDELAKDVERLQVITDRFSKIGSKPELSYEPLSPIIKDIIEYLDRRTPSNIKFTYVNGDEDSITAKVNPVLFQWVLENISKNAVDAISGKGRVIFKISQENKNVIIDIADTGKGMPRTQFKTVFRPGFTTKVRGWGLGLSLAKRIVEGYHGGKLFVKESEIGKGTTFRITLPA